MIRDLDDKTSAIFLKVPASKVALMQSLFESYEGIGSVRTLDIKNSLISILCTKDQKSECLAVLDSIQKEAGWHFAETVEEKFLEDYYGYMQDRHQGIKES